MPPRRGPSRGGWGRLRPVELDPLDVYGLPSKGETRLADFKTQERYYTKIVERYLAFCTDAKGRDGLLERFASLELAERTAASAASAASAPDQGRGSTGASGTKFTPATPSGSIVPSPTSVTDKTAGSRDLADVLMALRKLREAIVATGRADDFATQAYLFCIRLAILAKQPEAYHPALQHLLRGIHHRHPLTSLAYQEVVGYLVLDAACRRDDLAAAYHLRCVHHLRSAVVDGVLAALAHDDWVAFHRLRRRVDGHQARLLDFAVPALRVHTLKCFGRAYLRLDDVRLLEAATAAGWAKLQAEYGVGWERDGNAVIIRKVQRKRAVAPLTATGPIS